MNNRNMQALFSTQKHSFVGYLVAGYPNREESLALARSCCEKGLDILEIGFPARNPSFDGEVIRNAQGKAEPVSAEDLGYWQELRAAVTVPIWLMGYYDDLVSNGTFLKLAWKNVYDVLVVPDMGNAERVRLAEVLAPLGVDVAGFTGPMTDAQELSICFEHLPLIYQQLYCGPTGEANNSMDYLPLLRKSRERSQAKVFAGFGITTPERARDLLQSGFDGVVVGSSIVKQLGQSVEAAYELINHMRDVVRSV